MKCNVGTIDRVIRAVLGLILIGIGFSSGNMIVGLIGLIPLGTAVISFCPLYPLLGINTGCKKG